MNARYYTKSINGSIFRCEKRYLIKISCSSCKKRENTGAVVADFNELIELPYGWAFFSTGCDYIHLCPDCLAIKNIIE